MSLGGIMKKQFGLVLAVVLCGALSVGVAPKASAAAAYKINTQTDWAVVAPGGNITLNNGDTLDIAPEAGSPSTSTVIFIATNANVTINGGNTMRDNVCIAESASDTASHTVTINNLQITAPTGCRAYQEYRGTIDLVGWNVFVGPPNNYALATGGVNVANITSSVRGALTVNSTSTQGYSSLWGGTLNVQGTAGLFVNASGNGLAVYLASAVTVDSGATLAVEATDNVALYGISLVVTNNGTLIVIGGTGGHQALLSSSGSPTINMGVSAVASITSYTPETDSFVMIPASGYQWLIGGGASLVAPSTVASSPASIRFTGTWGVVKLTPPGTAMYRIFSTVTGEHFYTSSAKEVQVNVNSGAWKYEGLGWVAPLSGTQVYRLAAIPGSGSAGHLFTTSATERDAALASRNPAGQPYWKCETGVGMPSCVGWYSGGSVPVFRAYFPGNGQHNYTTDSNEQRVITTQQGWTGEGIGWYGVQTGISGWPMPV